MKCGFCSLAGLVTLCGIFLFIPQAEARKIRLQNETIDTATSTSPGYSAAAEAILPSGLVLVQFRTPPDAALRNELRERGVDLLAPVPDDAFVARIRGIDRSWLRAHATVEWMGAYKPEHKIHGKLASVQAQGRASAKVKVLVAPGASQTEKAEVLRSMDAVEQESSLSLGTVVQGRLNLARLAALQSSDAVLWIEAAPDMKLMDEVASKIVAGDGGPNYLLSQSLGYDGSGVTVAVADSGLNNGDAASMHPDLLGRTPAFFFYGLHGELLDAADEHSHGTHVAGIIAGNGATSETDEAGFLYGLGVAPGASIIAQRLFDGVGNYFPPPSFERMTRDAKRAGADIGSNSWGDDTYGRYDLSAAEFDALVRDCDALTPGDQEYILEFSAGNAGPQEGSIGSPAVAKNVIATGASQNDRVDFLIYGDGAETMADFSSRGPCLDGRIKPDVVAPGTYIASLQSASATDEFAWAPISPYYQYQGGTSQAGPHVSGAAAVFVDFWRQTHGTTPSPALVKAALINSAVDLLDEFGTDPVPNMDEGWGRVDLATLFDPELQFNYLDQETCLAQDQVHERHMIVSSSAYPLKITMVYTDVPGIPSAAAALVNDLDLEVIAPNGTVYRGNQFEFGESMPNASQSDRINNVEGVLVYDPVPGQYVVRVRARSVMAEARQDTDPIDQDFALVCSGVLARPGEGVLAMDRQVYRAPHLVRIFLADPDLAGVATVPVTIASDLEPAGEQIVLQASGASGAFTGSVMTATGPATHDGKLQVAHGNTITAKYLDGPSATLRQTTALADLVPPVLSQVSFRVIFAAPEVSWISSEPAFSVVQYGTSQTNLNLAATNKEFASEQTVVLEHVIPGVQYYYRVLSADEAGNWSTNDNQGALYTFTISSLKPVLVVDTWPEDFVLPSPPIAGYTAPLSQIGIDYDLWDASTMGSPAAVLPNYQCVLWRFNEFSGAWTATERHAISNYLHSGGALLVGSMEILTATTDSAFLKNVLHVESYLSDEQGAEGVSEVYGEPLDPVLSGFSAVLNYNAYAESWGWLGIPADISDTVFPDDQASVMLLDVDGDPVGIRWPGLGKQGPGRLALMSFPIDAVEEETGERAQLLEKLMSFLIPGASRNGSLQFNSAAYQSPGRAVIQLGDKDLANQSSLQLTVRSSSDNVGVPVTLQTSSAAGRLEGSVDITLPSNPLPDAIRAQHGDTLTVSYFDASAGVTRTATAMVDNLPAALTNVEAEADYVEAWVYWETSEPADSLVLFGESPLLGRSAYNASYETLHGVRLGGLVPNRTYYYKVVSRDAAGNFAEANNTNALYQLQTKTPLQPPWGDDMESGANDWTTFVDESSFFGTDTANWELGVPNNSMATEAHSTNNCWGTNLREEYRDFSECLLISPAMYLPAGESSILTFWHNYDFVDYSGFDLEFAFLQISVNNGPLQDVPGQQYDLSSFGWEEITVDLTAYAGNMVMLVWHYGLLAFEDGPRPGWLVDDVSITSQAYTGGAIIVTNNIWQADYVLSGPISRAGKGPLTVSNAPPGEYYLEFAPVPYYNTPPAQTNVLEPGQTLFLWANYTMPDANLNGISDLWEMAFFHEISTNRTSLTDSDGDSMTDYAEFVVGTDPLGSAAPFALTSSKGPGASLQLEWKSMPGQTYSVQSSTNLANWLPASEPFVATSIVSSVSIPVGEQDSLFFRAATPIGATASTLPPNLRVVIDKVPGGGARLTWRSPNRCGYLIEGSNDLKTWTPVSPWIRAMARTTVYTLPSPLPQLMYYRLRAEP